MNDSPLVANDAERCVLGSIILKNEDIPKIQRILSSADFGVEAHSIIYQCIVETYAKIGKVDLVLLKESLGADSLNRVGGISYLGALVEKLPSTGDAERYSQLVAERSRIRRIVAKAKAIEAAALQGESLKKPSEELYQLVTSEGSSVRVDYLDAAISSIDAIRKQGVDLAFGIREVDDIIGGVRRGMLYTVGGKTSHGKTSVAANITRANLRLSDKTKILYNGYENIEQIPTRLAAMESGIRLDWFLKPHEISEDAYMSVKAALEGLKGYRDRVKIVNGASIGEMRQICSEFKPDIIFVDYLQAYAFRHNLAADDRLSHAVGKAASDLQDLAIKHNAAVFNFSQLSRRPEEHRRRAPQIEDLKESGDIENVSDVIVLVHWPWRDTLSTNDNPNEYKFLVRKNKLGPCLDISACIDTNTLKITSWGC